MQPTSKVRRFPRGKGSRQRLRGAALRAVPDDWRERVFRAGEAEIISRYSGIPVAKVHALGQIAVLALLGRWDGLMLPVELRAEP